MPFLDKPYVWRIEENLLDFMLLDSVLSIQLLNNDPCRDWCLNDQQKGIAASVLVGVVVAVAGIARAAWQGQLDDRLEKPKRGTHPSIALSPDGRIGLLLTVPSLR